MIRPLSQCLVAQLMFLLLVILPGLGSGPDRETNRINAAPERAVVIRLSESIFQPGEDRRVDRVSDVYRIVLGTDVTGKCRTVGDVSVDLVPNDEDGSFRLLFHGVCYSRTVGTNGPAVIHNSAITRFQCFKKVSFDVERGFHAQPSDVRAQTQLTNERITSRPGGLLGRVVKTVASRRVQANHEEATWITNRDTEQDIREGFDEAIDAHLAKLNQRLDLPRVLAAIFGTATDSGYRVRTNFQYMEICFHDAGIETGSLLLPVSNVPESPIEVWARAQMFDSKIRTALHAYAIADRLVETLSPFNVWSDRSEADEPSTATTDIDAVDGWFVFAVKTDAAILSLASRD